MAFSSYEAQITGPRAYRVWTTLCYSHLRLVQNCTSTGPLYCQNKIHFRSPFTSQISWEIYGATRLRTGQSPKKCVGTSTPVSYARYAPEWTFYCTVYSTCTVYCNCTLNSGRSLRTKTLKNKNRLMRDNRENLACQNGHWSIIYISLHVNSM